MTYELPAGYDPNNNRQVDIPKALLPLLAGRLRGLEYADAWIADDQIAGPQAALLVQERLLSDSVAINRMIARWTMNRIGGFIDIIGGKVLTSHGTVNTAGIRDEAQFFDGASYMETSGLLISLAGLAIEIWMYPILLGPGPTPYGPIPWFIRTSVGWIFPYLMLNGHQHQIIFDWPGFSSRQVVNTSNFYSRWTHLVLVQDPADRTVRLYRNGVLIHQTTAQALLWTGQVLLSVGRRFDGYYWVGSLDELAIYQFEERPADSYWQNRYNGGAGRMP